MKYLFFEYIERDYFFDLNRRTDPSYYLPITMIFLFIAYYSKPSIGFKWFT